MGISAYRSVLGQSALGNPLSQDGLSGEIVFQHFVETAKSEEFITRSPPGLGGE
jgi:hypothetical protein